jgi:DnaJ-domain-containing protein 1
VLTGVASESIILKEVAMAHALSPAAHVAPLTRLSQYSTTSRRQQVASANCLWSPVPQFTLKAQNISLASGAFRSSYTGQALLQSAAGIRGPVSKRRSFKVSAAAAGVKIGRPIHGFDYYELLGVDPAAEAVQIKQAYRWLQVSDSKIGSLDQVQLCLE